MNIQEVFMLRRKLFLTVSSILLLATSGIGFCGKIVYPWRATTTIVKSGKSFEAWFDADNGQTVNSVELKGPYNSVVASFSVKRGDWKYDQWSGNTYDRKITVKVPVNAPADRYDLILKTSTGDETSLKAVKIIKDYKSSYYVMHFSDPHRWERPETTPAVIYNEQSTVIDIANIIDPEMFIETGDCFWMSTDRSTNTARLAEFINGTGTIKGLNDLHAPVFMIPGNHDTPAHNYYKEPNLAVPARAWNENFGLTCQNFTYGKTRFIGVNNSWCPATGGEASDYAANYQWQLDAAKDWINIAGKGNFRVGFFHVPQESVPPVYNALKSAGASFGLMLAGHIHRTNSNPFTIDGKAIVYAAGGVKNGANGAPFNLYKIDQINGTYEPVGNSSAAHSGLEVAKDYSTSKLKLTFAGANDGTHAKNTATIVNKFDFPIEGARVRFVVPKGALYGVSQGTVKQQFEGDSVHVVDVSVDLNANSTTKVVIDLLGLPGLSKSPDR
jgi:hypothetical protein